MEKGRSQIYRLWSNSWSEARGNEFRYLNWFMAIREKEREEKRGGKGSEERRGGERRHGN